jgi:hypothetical protein
MANDPYLDFDPDESQYMPFNYSCQFSIVFMKSRVNRKWLRFLEEAASLDR